MQCTLQNTCHVFVRPYCFWAITFCVCDVLLLCSFSVIIVKVINFLHLGFEFENCVQECVCVRARASPSFMFFSLCVCVCVCLSLLSFCSVCVCVRLSLSLSLSLSPSFSVFVYVRAHPPARCTVYLLVCEENKHKETRLRKWTRAGPFIHRSFSQETISFVLLVISNGSMVRQKSKAQNSN